MNRSLIVVNRVVVYEKSTNSILVNSNFNLTKFFFKSVFIRIVKSKKKFSTTYNDIRSGSDQ